MTNLLLALLLVGIVVVIVFVSIYNRLIVLRQSVKESWSAIATELRRRYDLIPNLVETVKGYAGHERETLENVIKARNAAVVTNAPVESQIQSQNVLTSALGKLIALSEAYPQLKANENFNQLHKDLSDTETRISQARRFYNANVRELNTACETFPSSIVAGMASIKSEPYYESDDANAYNPVSVKFTNTDKA